MLSMLLPVNAKKAPEGAFLFAAKRQSLGN